MSALDQDVAVAGRAVRVLGLGASGEAAARLLIAEGAAVTVLDRADTPALAARAGALRALGVRIALGEAPPPAERCVLVVVSPGVALTDPWAQDRMPAGVPVVGELEWAARHCRCPLLAITGTNGKSTLATLCAEALELAGRRVRSGGNLGTPLSRWAPESGDLDWLVVEVSSFQLETVDTFRPRIGVVLNLQPNHLDRHGTFEVYAGLKRRLFARMGAGDLAVVPEDLAAAWLPPQAAEPPVAAGPEWRVFGLGAATPWRYAAGAVQGPGGVRIDLTGTRFANPILGQAAAAAAAALAGAGVDAATLERAIRANRPLPHRLMALAPLRGVSFVDDSKATSLAAMAAALTMAPGPVHLIAGGLLKETDLDHVQELLAKRVRAVYGIGKAASRMQQAWSACVTVRDCGDMERAVRAAFAAAQPGETILLSPGCASFDQYRNFEERGVHFARIVDTIRKEE